MSINHPHSSNIHQLYRVSQEERTKLREGVPYVKLYRYNPKHLCPKLNSYWDNGQIKLWLPSGPRTIAVSWLALSVYARGCSILILLTLTWNAYPCMSGRQTGSQTSRVTSPLSIPVWCIVLRTLCITITRVRGTLQFKLMALCHSQVTLMLSTDINITETTYSCQFQYEFGNQ